MLFLIFINALAYSSYIIALKMLLSSYDQFMVKEEAKTVKAQLSLERKQYAQVLKNIETTKKMRHDLRHHLLILKDYANDSKIDNLKEYLNQMIDEVFIDSNLVFCENQTINILLKYYHSLAKKYNVKFDVDILIPAKIKINDSDLCIIFGNLIENALDATKHSENSFIMIKTKKINKQLAIMIENSYSNKLKQKGENFLSTKHEGEAIGLASVKSIIKKYNAFIMINAVNNIFSVHILMNI